MEDNWIYEYIVQYLKSPEWKTPVMTFIDNNCIYFESDEENKLEYSDIHENFMKMIEGLLEGQIKDLGISEEEFMKACEEGRQSAIGGKVFDQILAVDNFVTFKRMMLRRKREIELEAYQIMSDQELKRLGVDPSELSDHEDEGFSDPAPVIDVDSKSTEVAATGTETKGSAPTEEKVEGVGAGEVDKVMTDSLQAEEERRRLIELEEEQLRKALEESEKEFEMQKQKQIEEEKKMQEEIRESEENKKREEEEQKKKAEEENQKEVEKLAEEERQKHDQKKKEEDEMLAAKKKFEEEEALRAKEQARKIMLEREAAAKALAEKEQSEREVREKRKREREEKKENEEKKQPIKSQAGGLGALPALKKKPTKDVTKDLSGFDKIDVSASSEKKEEIKKLSQEEEMARRAERIKAHRDAIIRKKNEERQKELDKFQEAKTTVPEESEGEKLKRELTTTHEDFKEYESKQAAEKEANSPDQKRQQQRAQMANKLKNVIGH
mmetsp:Transcript_28594/g.32684  ORF Transcript_28594/g.32684 Transcript_28594/m.32684 type:complete len:496 (-) Transcript_28594:157-1644(-)